MSKHCIANFTLLTFFLYAGLQSANPSIVLVHTLWCVFQCVYIFYSFTSFIYNFCRTASQTCSHKTNTKTLIAAIHFIAAHTVRQKTTRERARQNPDVPIIVYRLSSDTAKHQTHTYTHTPTHAHTHAAHIDCHPLPDNG